MLESTHIFPLVTILNIQLSQFANFTKTKMVSCFRLSFQQVEYCFIVNLGS